MEAIEELLQLFDSMRQASALLADEDVDETASSSALSKQPSTFLNVVALGNTSQYAERSDAILLVVIPAAQAPEVTSAKAIRIAKELDGECTRTVGVISKIDQASSEPKVLAAVQALLLNQGPRSTSDIPWVALIGQYVSIAST